MSTIYRMRLFLKTLDLDKDQSIGVVQTVVQTVVQPTLLEVIVTNQQCTMTFNNKQVHVCKQVQMDTSKPILIKILIVSETL